MIGKIVADINGANVVLDPFYLTIAAMVLLAWAKAGRGVARIIPSLSTPASLAGFRFVTTITLLGLCTLETDR